MNDELVLGIVPPQGDDFDLEAFYEFLDRAPGDFETFSRGSSFTGGAAFDLGIILNVAGSVASIAQLFWMAYRRFSPPSTADARNRMAIYMFHANGEVETLVLDEATSEEEEFVSEFVHRSEIVRASAAEGDYVETLKSEFRYSSSWSSRRPPPSPQRRDQR